MKYTKAALEELLWRQLSHIDEQNEQLALLKEQTVLLKHENEKLRASLGLIPPVPKPYPKQKTKKVELPIEFKNIVPTTNDSGNL